MSTSSLKYRKCTYAVNCPLQGPQLSTRNEMSNHPDVRYLCEVDERLGAAVRLYAVVESFVREIKAELLIEQIRAQILPFDRTFGEHPVNNTGNDTQLVGLLGTILASTARMCSHVCKGQKEETANIAIIIIRGRLILCGSVGEIVGGMKAECPAFFRMGLKTSIRYLAILINYKTVTVTVSELKSLKVVLQKGNNFTTMANSLVHLHVHEMQPTDLRFFVFTKESVRALLRSVPSLTLFTKSPEFIENSSILRLSNFADDIIWLLYLWQTEMYSKNPYKLPAASFILVDNLPELVVDDGTRLDQGFIKNLLDSNEKIRKGEWQAKETRKEQRQRVFENNFTAQSNMLETSEESTNQSVVYLQTELKKVQKKYGRVTELISELLHQERDEVLAYMRREREILNLERECGQQMVLKGKVMNLRRRQQKQLAELRIFLRKILKYQEIVECELLINIEKLEQKINVPNFGTDETYLREKCYHHQRMRSVTLFQNRIEQNLEYSRTQMQELMRNSFRMQWKLDTLRSQVERNRRMSGPLQGTRPLGRQVHFKNVSPYRAAYKYPRYNNGFPKHYCRRNSGNGMMWNNNYNRNR